MSREGRRYCRWHHIECNYIKMKTLFKVWHDFKSATFSPRMRRFLRPGWTLPGPLTPLGPGPGLTPMMTRPWGTAGPSSAGCAVPGGSSVPTQGSRSSVRASNVFSSMSERPLINSYLNKIFIQTIDRLRQVLDFHFIKHIILVGMNVGYKSMF